MKRATRRVLYTLGLALAVTGCATEDDLNDFGEANEAELAAERGERPGDDGERDDRREPPAPDDEQIDRLPLPDDDAEQDDGRAPPPDGERPERGDRPPRDDGDDRPAPPAPPEDDGDDRPAPPAPPEDGPQDPIDDDDPIDDADPIDDDFAQPLAPSPADNRLTGDKVELGRLLFWDPILSGNGDVSCATCHHPDFGYADGLPLSVGVGGDGVGPNRDGAILAARNAPTVLNTGLNGWLDDDTLPNPTTAPMFWDSRERSLENQALGPIQNAEEMRGDAYSAEDALDVVVGRLRDNDTYAALFMDVFGGALEDAVTAQNLGKAIAAFERHLSRPDSPFDRWLAGDDRAMSAQQVRGFNTFNRVGCDDCHAGPMFSDYRLRRIGAPNNADNPTDDGDGTHRYRTASLRNIAQTGPYMHGGTFANLGQVFAFYRRPGAPPPPGQGLLPRNIGPLDRDVVGLRFNGADEADMAAFLRALSDSGIDTARPVSVPSGLPVGGNL